MTQDSYQTNQVEFIYGGSDFKAQMSEHVDSPATWRLSANIGAPTLRPQTRKPTQGIRRIGDSIGMRLVLPCWLTDETAKVEAQPRGIVVVRRHDANYAYAFAAEAEAVSYPATGQGITKVNLTFTQDRANDGLIVFGVPDSDAGYTVKAGEVAVVVGESSVTVVTTDGNVPDGDDSFVVVGPLMRGEGHG